MTALLLARRPRRALSETACAPADRAGDRRPAPAAKRRTVSRGIDLAGIDRSVAPGDDFFLYANGTWLKNTEIPADPSQLGRRAACSSS